MIFFILANQLINCFSLGNLIASFHLFLRRWFCPVIYLFCFSGSTEFRCPIHHDITSQSAYRGTVTHSSYCFTTSCRYILGIPYQYAEISRQNWLVWKVSNSSYKTHMLSMTNDNGRGSPRSVYLPKFSEAIWLYRGIKCYRQNLIVKCYWIKKFGVKCYRDPPSPPSK